jgi:hydrogenase maturation protease
MTGGSGGGAAIGSVAAIGLGNPLLGDDGVGLRVIEALRSLARSGPGMVPPATRLVAAGPPSLDLLEILAGARAVVLVDAIDRGARPGSVTVTRGDALDREVGGGNVGDLLLAARLTGRAPDTVALVGIQVGSLDTGTRLSEAVEAAVPTAVNAACRELSRPAVGPRRRGWPSAEAPGWPSAEAPVRPAAGVCA